MAQYIKRVYEEKNESKFYQKFKCSGIETAINYVDWKGFGVLQVMVQGQ